MLKYFLRVITDKGLILVREQSTFPSAKKRKSKNKYGVFQNSDF